MSKIAISSDHLRIGELAAQAGTSHRTIHYYEGLGLLKAPVGRKNGAHRVYGIDALQRLRLIERLKELGLSLEEIAEVLPLYTDDPKGIRGKQEVVAILKRHLLESERKLSQLLAFRKELAGKIELVEKWLAQARR